MWLLKSDFFTFRLISFATYVGFIKAGRTENIQNRFKEVIFQTYNQSASDVRFVLVLFFRYFRLVQFKETCIFKHFGASCLVNVFRVLFGFVLHIRGSNIHVLLDFVFIL